MACLVNFVELIFLCSLSLPNFFFRVCLPTPFAALLNFFLPPKNSAVSDTVNTVKPTATRFAARMTYIHVTLELLFSQKLVEVNRIIFHAVDQCNYSTEFLFVLKQPFYNVFLLKINVGDFSKHQDKSSKTHRFKNNSAPLVSLKSM